MRRMLFVSPRLHGHKSYCKYLCLPRFVLLLQSNGTNFISRPHVVHISPRSRSQTALFLSIPYRIRHQILDMLIILTDFDYSATSKHIMGSQVQSKHDTLVRTEYSSRITYAFVWPVYSSRTAHIVKVTHN